MRLFSEWAALTEFYPGWTLEDIKGLSKRERNNWLEIAITKHGRSSDNG
jgi:hypothetical protein